MTRRRAAVAMRLALVFLVATALFVVLVDWFRQAEASTVVRILHALGVTRVSNAVAGTVFVFPAGDIPVRAVITESCTSLGALVALVAITLFVIRAPIPRRLLALGVTSAVIVAGNLARITASVAVGLWAGSDSLVLFHDWVATGFGLAYTLVGLVLMLWMLLPASDAARPTARESVGD